MHNNSINKIAIVKLSSFGDIVHALPLLCALKTNLPKSKIFWIVESQYKSLIEGHECLEGVIPVELKKWKSRLRSHADPVVLWQEVRKCKQDLRKHGFDLAIDAQGLVKSGFVTLATGAKTRIGFHPRCCREPAAAFCYNKWVFDQSRHIFHKNLSLGKEFGVSGSLIEFRLPVAENDRRWAKGVLREIAFWSFPLVLLHPGTRWQSKMWPKEYYVQLLYRLRQLNLNLVLCGGSSETEYIASLSMKTGVPYLTEMSVAQYKALIEQCDLFIASDTGPLHLAAALEKKTVSFYGPAKNGPDRIGPFGKKHIIFYRDLPCRGCGQRVCADSRCMKEIAVSDVYEAVLKQLRPGSGIK